MQHKSRSRYGDGGDEKGRWRRRRISLLIERKSRLRAGHSYLMLQNRIYRGDIVHQGTAYPGQHKAILDPELWQIVQDKLAANRQERSLAVGAEAPSLLAGLIVAGGRLAGGQHFSRGALYLMLQNRTYRGEITHQGTAYPGQHKAILDPELWQIVQDKLTANRRERSLAVGAEAPSLLAGLIVDSDGNRMTPTHATKRAKRYRYYVSAPLLAGEGLRVSAGDIEALVLDRLTTQSAANRSPPA